VCERERESVCVCGLVPLVVDIVHARLLRWMVVGVEHYGLLARNLKHTQKDQNMK